MLDTGNVELQKKAIPQARSLEILRGMGLSNPNFLKDDKKAMGVERVQPKKTVMGVGLDIILNFTITGKQGWCSGESARLPSLWPGFDSQTRRHKWVEFVLVLFSASRVSLQVLLFSSLTKNQHTADSTHGPYSGCQRRHCKLSVRPSLSCVVAVLCDGD